MVEGAGYMDYKMSEKMFSMELYQRGYGHESAISVDCEPQKTLSNEHD